MFSNHPQNNFCFEVTFILSSTNAFNLDLSKILSFEKDFFLSYSKVVNGARCTRKLPLAVEVVFVTREDQNQTHKTYSQIFELHC